MRDMIDHGVLRTASRQVAALLDPLLRLPDAEQVADYLREQGASDGLDGWLREGLAERVIVRVDDDAATTYIDGEVVRRHHLGPGAPLRMFVRRYRAGAYPDLLPDDAP